MNRNWTVKLQVTLLFYFLKEIIFAHFQSLLGRSNRSSFLENEGKYIKKDMWKSFFLNFKVGISQLFFKLTSSQVVVKDFK